MTISENDLDFYRDEAEKFFGRAPTGKPIRASFGEVHARGNVYPAEVVLFYALRQVIEETEKLPDGRSRKTSTGASGDQMYMVVDDGRPIRLANGDTIVRNGVVQTHKTIFESPPYGDPLNMFTVAGSKLGELERRARSRGRRGRGDAQAYAWARQAVIDAERKLRIRPRR